jgi:hypothetical protein
VEHPVIRTIVAKNGALYFPVEGRWSTTRFRKGNTKKRSKRPRASWRSSEERSTKPRWKYFWMEATIKRVRLRWRSMIGDSCSETECSPRSRWKMKSLCFYQVSRIQVSIIFMNYNLYKNL